MFYENMAMLEDTLSIFEQGYYELNGKRVKLKLSPEEQMKIDVFMPREVEKLAEDDADAASTKTFERTEVSCERLDSFSFARRRTEMADKVLPAGHRPVLVLNFASPVRPGGGVRRGSRAQEESLCQRSSLLLSLESEAAEKYYKYHRARATFMGSDAIMITPSVEIIKDQEGRLLPESVIVSVMTCAAPKLSYGKEGMSEAEYRNMMYNRIMRILKLAAHEGYQMLILGAFGCGAYHNDAEVVSKLFYIAMKDFDFNGLKLEDCFRSIDFAVLDHSESQYNYNCFARIFNHFYHDEG